MTLEETKEKAVSYKHVFTHLEWDLTGWFIQCRAESSEFTWVTVEELNARYPLPSAFHGFNSAFGSILN